MRLVLLFVLAIVEAKRKQPKVAERSRQLATLLVKQQNNPYSIYSHPVAVDFINIGKEGILDPLSGLKQPYDGLGFDLRYPTSPEEELKMLQNSNPNRLIKITKGKKKKPTSPVVSVREYNPDLGEIVADTTKNKVVNNKMPLLFDFETIQNLNVASPSIYRGSIEKTEALFRRRQPPDYNDTVDQGSIAAPNVTEFFFRNSFQLEAEVNINHENWTTCDDFALNASFHPREVAGVDWEAFYVWAPSSFPSGFDFSFSYPTLKIVEEYRAKYSQHVNKTIDWKQPMLLLKSWIEILLVAGDRRGLFFGIPKFDLPEPVKNTSAPIPILTMRMKIVEPYLGIMLCEERIGLILAVAGEEPVIKDRATEAAKLGFIGIGQILVKDLDTEVVQEREKTLYEELEEAAKEPEDLGPRRPLSPFFVDD